MLKDLKLSDYQLFIEQSKDLESEEDVTRVMYQCLVEEDMDKPYKDIVNEIGVIGKEIKEAKDSFSPIIEVNDVRLGFIPDLESATFGEVMDLDSYMNDVKLHHKLMAILYRPITDEKGKKYEILDYTGTSQTADKMKNLPLVHYFAAIGFFEHLGMDLQNAFPSYSNHLKEIATK